MGKKKTAKKPLAKKAMKSTKGGHSGGINVGMADGSVRFVSQTVSQIVELPAVQKTT
ncbi:MAG TPA: H-X9-DG-CTERM domain-containing protein [Planctomycetota bacterium]